MNVNAIIQIFRLNKNTNANLKWFKIQVLHSDSSKVKYKSSETFPVSNICTHSAEGPSERIVYYFVYDMI